MAHAAPIDSGIMKIRRQQTMAHQAIAKTAQSFALIICTLFSMPMFLNAGAAPTNKIPAQAKKAKKVRLDSHPPIASLIESHPGIKVKAMEVIIAVNK